jgi:hypothetical protein
METIEFRTKIKNGVIQVPAKYKGKFKDSVRVIVVTEDKTTKAENYLDEIMAHPWKVKRFRPLTREEAHARK